LALFLAAFFGTGCSAVCCAAWNAAHRFFVAAEIAFRPAALIFRRLPLVGSGVAAGSEEPPVNRLRSSAICVSMWSYCCSKPMMAAVMISFVSFVGMLAFRTNYVSSLPLP
jgi:hypothetical protein